MIAPKHIRILYAEGDEDSCLMTRILLGHSGIHVECARTISEALGKAKKEKFDAFLLDGRFVDGSGLMLCRRLLEIDPHIPIVFYTGNGRITERKLGLAAGAGAYLVKPDIHRIAPTIQRLVASAAMRHRRGYTMAVNP